MGMGQPNDSTCNEDCECASESCYTSALGGLCGECTSDADCPGGGCTPPDPLTSPPVGAVCNDGGFAEGCETDAACQDPYICVNVIDVPGLLESNTCSECQSDADCGGDLCSPEYAFPSIGGYWECVAPDSEGLGTACDFVGSGDQSCTSGFCAVADIMGILSIGVCSECEVDGDCLLAQVCVPAEVDIGSGALAPATCQDP
jgi:hypothetical protein